MASMGDGYEVSSPAGDALNGPRLKSVAAALGSEAFQHACDAQGQIAAAGLPVNG